MRPRRPSGSFLRRVRPLRSVTLLDIDPPQASLQIDKWYTHCDHIKNRSTGLFSRHGAAHEFLTRGNAMYLSRRGFVAAAATTAFAARAARTAATATPALEASPDFGVVEL